MSKQNASAGSVVLAMALCAVTSCDDGRATIDNIDGVHVNRLYGSEVRKVVASDAEPENWFGYSVSIDADTAIAGAPLGDSGEDGSGAAYVYFRNEGGTGNWGEIKKLVASDASTYDRFGHAVAIDGDTGVVGAIAEDSTASQAGAAYVFYRNEGGLDNWGEVAKLTASDGEAMDFMGESVSISGTIAVIGASGKDFGTLENTGAAYVFERDHGGPDNWGEIAKLVAGDMEEDSDFGGVVFVDGDAIFVGARFEDTNGVDAGAVYVYYRDQGGPGNWGQFKKMVGSDTVEDDFFGCSVSVDENTAVVGAYSVNGAGETTGAAYVFYRNEGGTDNWGEVRKIEASDAEAGDYFGMTLSLAGDIIIVGAIEKDVFPDDTGDAYLFARNHGGPDAWGEVDKLTPGDGEPGDSFGMSVGISDEMALAGSPYESSLGTSSGAFYVFEILPGSDADAGPDASVDAGVDASTDTDSNTDSGMDTDTDTDSDNDSDTDTDTDADTDTDNDTDTDTDTDGDSDADGHADEDEEGGAGKGSGSCNCRQTGVGTRSMFVVLIHAPNEW